MTELRDILLVIQLIATVIVVLFMKYFYSELQQRDIKIEQLDKRMEEVEENYIDRFDKVINKQDEMLDSINIVNIGVAEIKQMVKDQKEFCVYVQEEKRK